MKYATAAAFRRALETRLLEHSRISGLSIMRLRRTVVFERLLARLLQAAPDRWVLKGGLALDYRLGARARTTKDMDLGRHDDEATGSADLRTTQQLDLGDYFVFRIERTSHLDAALEGTAVRYRVSAELAGRPFDTVTLDVSFGPPSAFTPDGLGTSDLLAFAGIEPLTVPALPLPEHVAEKVHAYTRTYGAQGLSGTGVSSTRVKDLIDLALIASTASLPTHFRADDLRRALVATFAARATHMLQVSLPAPPAGWAAPYAKLAAEVGIDPEVLAGHRLVAGFLDPVLSGAAAGKHWDPATQTWEADA